MGLKF